MRAIKRKIELRHRIADRSNLSEQKAWSMHVNVVWTETTSANLSSPLIYPLTARVIGAQQMISQPVSSIFLCSPLPSGTWRTLGLSIPCCCLPTSSSVCLVFFPLSLCLARWFWPDLMNGRHDHTTVSSHSFCQIWCTNMTDKRF